jgi:hypothetical protein
MGFSRPLQRPRPFAADTQVPNPLIFVPIRNRQMSWRKPVYLVVHRSETYRSALSEAIAQREKIPIADTTSQRAMDIVMMVIFCFGFIKPLGSERRF